MSSPYVINLDKLSHLPPLELVGGKCYQLARISSLNLPVPTWVCVSTAAFDKFLSEHSIHVSSNLSADIAQSIRDSITQNHIPDIVRSPIEHAISMLLQNSSSGAV